MYLATAQEMNAWDAATIKMGMPAFSLMENASREVWHVLCNFLAKNSQSLQDKRVLLFAGGGNNGGDAIALARLLHNKIPQTASDKVQVTLEENSNLYQPSACHVLVVHTRPLQDYKGMAQEHLQLAMACGVRFMPAEDWLEAIQYGSGPFVDMVTKRQSTPHIIVDGLLGTGFHGPLRGTTLAVIERLNQWLDQHNTTASTENIFQPCQLFSPLSSNKISTHPKQSPALFSFPHIIAIDCPSGLDSTTGAPSPTAIAAHTTVTFEAAKIGLVSQAARPYVGNVLVRPIGIPTLIQAQHPTECTLLHRSIMRHLPSIGKLGHKGDAGHVLVIGGSQGLTGAAHLSAKAALRSGSGLVSMAVPRGLELQAQCSVPDIMVMGVGCVRNPKTDNHAAPTIYDAAKWPRTNLQEALYQILELAASCRALVLGPGIGRSPEAATVVHAILSMPKRPPVVIDADALFSLAQCSVLPSPYWQSLMVCTNTANDNANAHQAPNPLLSLVQSHDILTPHPTEAARILGWTTAQVQADRMAALKTLMSMVKGTVILKGACTLIGQAPKSLTPSPTPIPSPTPSITVSPFIEPHLSVAGSGDVLAGLVASLIAQGISPTTAAPLGVFLHVKVGALLAQQFPKRGNTASDLIDMLPQSLIP
ncbi:MAG: NAD(P)H-hydrate dehydratase [Pseudomonadota bacterium]